MRNRLGSLEVVRALAALAVMLGHMRGMYFVDYNELEYKNILAKLFYFLTGFGHQAVIVFFVLSGYFVGGSVLEKFESGRWSWTKYLTQRISRLWIVLIPSLFMTLLLDHFGSLNNPQLYQGFYNEIIHQGPQNGRTSTTLESFFGTVFFLQTWITPIFGSNGATWSLFNEFWYYLIFPLLVNTVYSKSRINFTISSTFLAAIFLFLPSSIIEGFFAWTAGAFIAKFHNSNQASYSKFNLYFSLFLFSASLALSRLDIAKSDSFTAISFCIFLIPLQSLQINSRLFSFISESSYSIYLFHSPFSLFIFSFFLPTRHQFGIQNSFFFMLLCFLCLIYCISLYFAFEFHTNSVRRLLEGRKSPSQPIFPK